MLQVWFERKKGRKEGRKERKKEGKEGRKEGRKERRKERKKERKKEKNIYTAYNSLVASDMLYLPAKQASRWGIVFFIYVFHCLS